MSSLLARKIQEKRKSKKVNTLNTPYLVVVESQAKCAKIEKFLGFQYKCIASSGHIRELINVGKEYLPDYAIIKDKETHVAWMREIVSHFSPEHIFIGTDDDREGEGIAWHLCQVFRLDVNLTKRILFHEVTQPALLKAIESPCRIRMNIVRSQQTRQILDRMIGFKISPILSRFYNSSSKLSAGRCQTPLLRLIYDRASNNNKEEGPKYYYKTQGLFFDHPSTIQLRLNTDFECEEDVSEFLIKSKSFSHMMLNMDPEKTKTDKPPLPFNTSSLLQHTCNTLHLSPKHVMDICQYLYQEGHITYMRTESKQYSTVFLSVMREYIKKVYKKDEYNCILLGENENNPHEAIRVTNIEMKEVNHKDKKTNDVYRIIWNRTLESCMSPYVHEDHRIVISAPDHHYYETTMEIPVCLGWKRLQMNEEEMNKVREQKTLQLHYVQRLNGKTVPYKSIQCTLCMKDSDHYYNEAGLIKKLESLGIGRPSTYSLLVDIVQERKYVLKTDIEGEMVNRNEFTMTNGGEIEIHHVTKTFGASKNKLQIQELGIKTIQLLIQYFPALFEYTFTSRLEEELDKIVDVQDKIVDVQVEDGDPAKRLLTDTEALIDSYIVPLKMKMAKKYSVDEKYELIFGKSGAMLKRKGEKSWISLKNDLEIDFIKLENGEYRLEDLIENENKCLGIYEKEEVILKFGPYGSYVSWKDTTISLKQVLKKHSLEDITLDMVTELLSKEKNEKVLRQLDELFSVRHSKHGNYIYFKTAKMKKPKFLGLKNCPHNVLEDEIPEILEWIKSQL